MVGVNKISEAHNAKVDSRNTYLLYRNLVEVQQVDYLPFIKTDVHVVNSSANPNDDDGGLDPALLDL
jgi:hypothetical protein